MASSSRNSQIIYRRERYDEQEGKQVKRLTKTLHRTIAYTKGEDKNMTPIEMTPNDILVVLKKLAKYEDIGTPDELKKLKEDMTFTGLELAKIAAESKELQDYKNLEGYGLLLKLPCKKGDYIYEICKEFSFSDMKFKKYYIVEREVVGINLFFCNNKPSFTVTGKDIVGNMILRAFINKDFGKNVFLSREEAEKRMEEIKNNA